jgi:hypothetical protein
MPRIWLAYSRTSSNDSSDLDATAFAAPARMNLRLDHPDLATQAFQPHLTASSTDWQNTPRGTNTPILFAAALFPDTRESSCAILF